MPVTPPAPQAPTIIPSTSTNGNNRGEILMIRLYRNCGGLRCSRLFSWDATLLELAEFALGYQHDCCHQDQGNTEERGGGLPTVEFDG